MSRVCFALFGVIVCIAAAASAAEPPKAPSIDKIEIGFHGKYKLGYWTYVHVTLSGDSEPNAWLEVTVLDGDGVPCTCRASSDGGFIEDLSCEVLVKPGRHDTPFIVTWRTKDRILATRTFRAPDVPAPLPSSQQLYLTLFANDDELAKLIPQPREEALRAQVVAMVPGKEADTENAIMLASLPAYPAAYEGVDGILFNFTRKDAYFVSLSFRTAAIFLWARQGGKLVVCANQCAEQGLALGYMPRIGKLSEPVTLRKATSLEHYADIPNREDLGDSFGSKNLDVPVPRLTDVTGKIECYDGVRPTDLPLVIRQPFGFGELVFVALDWDAPPIAGWSGRGYLFDKLFRRSVNPAEKSSDFAGGLAAQAGYDDLSGQLRAALDQFPGVTPIPFWSIALLMVVYLAIIGPLDYYVVHRVFQRMQVAWLTFPLSILLFCGLAFWLAHADKGTVVRVRQVDLVDADLDEGMGVWKDSPRERGTSWFQIFSPRSDVFNLSLQTMTPQRERGLAWLGLPGSALGGMNVSSGESLEAAPSQGYALGPPGPMQEPEMPPKAGSIARFPIPVASSRALVAHYKGDVSNAPTIELRRIGEGQLVGSIAINGSTPLDDCVLFYEHSAYKLGRLEPAKPFTLDDRREPASIESYLNRRILQGDKIVATPYDPFDTDPRRILDMMMFYEAAGGRNYTHLLNRYQSELDLSEQLDLGRAILVGRTSVPAATLLRDGQPLAQPDDEHVTFVRYVISVKEKPENRN